MKKLIKITLISVLSMIVALGNISNVTAQKKAIIKIKNSSAVAADDVHITASGTKKFANGTAPGFNPAGQAPAGGSHNLDWTTAQNVTPIPIGGSIEIPVVFTDPWGGINCDSCWLTLGGTRITNATDVTYTPVAKFTTASLPSNGPYRSLACNVIAYPQGLLLRNVTHDNFTQQQPPPPPGGSQVHQFGSTVHMEVSMNGGQSWQPMTAPATVAVRVTDNNGGSGSTRTFDTEMLQLNLSGGTLPPGVMIRESPSRQSLGRTSITDIGGGQYEISSFFDVFTELTVDGGQTWGPSSSSTNVSLDEPTTTAGIPTLSQWGLIIFSLLLLGGSAWFIMNRQKVRMA